MFRSPYSSTGVTMVPVNSQCWYSSQDSWSIQEMRSVPT